MLRPSQCDTLLNGSVQMSTVSREVETGTTTLGLVCKDGVVLAADRRATAGTLIAHKRTKKVYRLDDNIGLTTAGLVGDLQVLARYITAEVELYKLKRGISMPVEACATLTANILSGSRFYPYWVQLVIGGWDRSGGHVFSLDAAGGSLPDKFVSSGSGSPYVYGVLEDHYKDDMTLDEGANLAIRAVTAAMKRDAVSGEGIDVALISKDGFKMFDDKEVVAESNDLVRQIAQQLRRRIVVRPDPSLLATPEEAEKVIREVIPPEAQITGIYFETETGELTIEALSPGMVIGRHGSILNEVKKKIGWAPKVVRTPPIPSKTVEEIRQYLRTINDERQSFLKQVGRRLAREVPAGENYVRITALGGFRQVGRSAALLSTRESKVLIDCGVLI